MSFYKVMANPRLPMEQRVAAAKFVSAHYGEQGKDIALNWLEARRPPTLPPLQAAFAERSTERDRFGPAMRPFRGRTDVEATLAVLIVAEGRKNAVFNNAAKGGVHERLPHTCGVRVNVPFAVDMDRRTARRRNRGLSVIGLASVERSGATMGPQLAGKRGETRGIEATRIAGQEPLRSHLAWLRRCRNRS